MTAQVNQCIRIFSGIQPTGIPHLGNYFGAIKRWVELSSNKKVSFNTRDFDCELPVFCIVDVHAYSSLNRIIGPKFYNNIMSTTASLLALGIDPDKCILFRQSDVLEHNYLDNVLDNFVTPKRLSHMTQFKDKSKESNLITNGLLNYPVLQAADILLYRTHLVPVGEDQVQHVELCRDMAKKFNSFTGSALFPLPEALLDTSIHSRRVKSLRNPEKKMSKSDPNLKSFIEVVDEPDIIIEKCKKSVTDCNSAIFFDPDHRPGVSNLIRIYHLATGDSFDTITDQFRGQETIRLKLRLADILIEKFREPRNEFKRLIKDEGYLEGILGTGAERARLIAMKTVESVKHLLGSKRATE